MTLGLIEVLIIAAFFSIHKAVSCWPEWRARVDRPAYTGRHRSAVGAS